MPKLFDRVALRDGRVGSIVEVFDDGVAFELEYETPGGPHPFELETIKRTDIARVLYTLEDGAYHEA